MATATRSDDSLSVAGWKVDEESASKSDRYLAARLAAAAAEYRRVTLLTFVLACVLAGLVWFAIGGLVEHWVVPHGLPGWARWAWLVTAAAALVTATLVWLVPLLRYRVNLVYAARAIEAEHPELHNDLVNTVLVKARPQAGRERVERTLERRAARELSHVPADEGVADQRPAVRLAAGVLAVIVGVLLYEMLGGKSLITSAARLVAPWSGLAVPARVKIGPPQFSWRQPGEDGGVADDPLRRLDVEAGAVSIVRGRQLVVTTEIRGLGAEERPVVVATPLRDDGAAAPQATPWRIAMSTAAARSAGGPARQRAVLPDAVRGLEHGVELAIEAGDAQSPPLRVVVVDTPSLLVREVQYDYPPYTGLGTETVAWQGDLRAVEGTRATLVVEGNRPLERAWIDLDCDGKPNKELRIAPHDLSRASGAIDLLLKPDRSGPAHDSYRLMFAARGSAPATSAGWVTEKLEHRIDVLPDLAPEITIEEPRQATLVVPPDAAVQIRVRAVDPDFGLARVAVETRIRDVPPGEGVPLPGRPLLDDVRRGVFEGVGVIVPRQAGAESGRVLEYRAVAVDTRPREPNVVATPWQALKIDASAPPPPQQPPQQQQPGSADGQGGGEEGGSQDGGRGSDGNGARGNAADRDPARRDPGSGRPDGEPPPAGTADRDQSRGDEAAQGERGGAPDGDTSSSPPAAGGAGDPQPQRNPQTAPGDRSERQDESRGGAAPDGSSSTGGDSPQNGAPGDAAQPGQLPRPGAVPQTGDRGDSRPDGQGGRGDDGNAGAGGQETDDGSRGESGSRAGSRRDGDRQAAGGDRGSDSDEAVAADGTNDGEALERILDHRRRQQPEAASEGAPERGRRERADDDDPVSDAPGSRDGDSDGPADDGRSGDDRGQPAGGDKGERKDGPGASPNGTGEQPQAGEGDPQAEGGTRPGQQTDSGRGSRDRGTEQAPASPTDAADAEAGGKAGSDANDAATDGDPARRPSAEGRPEQVQPEDTRTGAGDGQRGERQPGQGEPGQGEPGQDQPGQGQPGQGQPGQGQPGQGQPGQGQPGQGQPGQGEPGQGQPGGREPGEAERGSPSRVPGEEAPGDRAGADAAARSSSGEGSEPSETGGSAAGQRGADSDHAGPDASTGASDSQGREPGGDRDAGGGGVVGGGQPRDGAVASDEEPEARELEWADQDLAHARNAADLAIEHLRDSVASGRRDLLDTLGWTPEQAEAFLTRWQALRQLAGSDDPRQRGEFERTLRSLGLRPDGVRSSRDAPRDPKGGAAEGRRGRPPASYRDQFKAYLQGTGGP